MTRDIIKGEALRCMFGAYMHNDTLIRIEGGRWVCKEYITQHPHKGSTSFVYKESSVYELVNNGCAELVKANEIRLTDKARNYIADMFANE